MTDSQHNSIYEDWKHISGSMERAHSTYHSGKDGPWTPEHFDCNTKFDYKQVILPLKFVLSFLKLQK